MGKKVALLIGASAYQDARFPKLEKPGRDVAALASVLKDPGVGAFDDVRSCLDTPCDAIRREIARLFASRAHDDLVLLFFAGHGIKDDFGKLWLVAADTDRDLLTATAIGADFVTREMDQSRSRKQVLLLDCCHSGALAQGVRAADTTVGALEAFTGHGEGKVIITASDSYQYAWEGGETPAGFENSLFTHFLVEGLKSGRADVNGDGIVTLDELYKYIHSRVLATTPKQVPQWKLADASGDIEIAQNPAPHAPLPEDLLSAVKSPLPYVREGVIHELKRLLRGSNPALAGTAREALEALAADRDKRVRTAAAKVLEAASQGRFDVDGTADLDTSPRIPVPPPAPPLPAPPPPAVPPPAPAPAPVPAPARAPKSRRTVLVAALVGVPAAVVLVSLVSISGRDGTPKPVVPGGAPPTTFQFAPWPPGNGWATFELSIDGKSAGVLSNDGRGRPARLEPLAPGLHSFRLNGLTLHRPDGVPVSSGGWCENQFVASPGRDSYGVFLVYSWNGSYFQYTCSVQ